MRTKESKELLKLIDEKKGHFFALRLQQMTGQLAKNADLRKTRKEIACAMTILKEKEKGIHSTTQEIAKKEAAPKKKPTTKGKKSDVTRKGKKR